VLEFKHPITQVAKVASLLFILLNQGCGLHSDADMASQHPKDTVEIIHYNITVAPDLSNRLSPKLYPKPVSDTDIISALVDDFYPGLVTYDLHNHTPATRKAYQQDALRLNFINEKFITDNGIATSDLEINLKQFETQVERIQYLTNQSDKRLGEDQTKFKRTVSQIVELAEQTPGGADIWSYLDNGISNTQVDMRVDTVSIDKHTLKRDFACNVLIILTDGYIEAGLKNHSDCEGKKCHFLYAETIERFRKAFKASGMNDMQAFFQQEGYGIVPVNNPLLKNLHVLVLELYDRSKSKQGSAMAHPSDLEILKLFWSDWLTQSGVKSYQLQPIASSQKEAYSVIKSYLASRW